MNTRIALAGTLVLILLGFFSFVFYLDRYPPPYFDDCVYNEPAIRIHDGLTFAWPMASAAPFGKTVWAYHSPFFPHLQVLTFRSLGVSTFACRIPQWVAVFAAVFLLSAILIRFQCFWCAILVPLFWLGDRSLVESLYGRMDGLALLFLVASFGWFTRWLTTWNALALFWTGLFVGIAIGFHPVALVFLIGLGTASLFLCPSGSHRAIAYFGVGATIPAGVIATFVAPHFREAIQQFVWHAHLAKRSNWLANFWNLIVILRWSRYWAIALIAVTLLFLLPTVVWVGFRYRSIVNKGRALVLSSSLFALLGCIVLFSVSQLPYYLIYFSVWPTVAVLVMLETNILGDKLGRAARIAVAVLVIAWLPSAAWNAMRWREARIFYPLFDSTSFVERVQNAVPTDADIEVSPEYFILSRRLGRSIVRPPLASAPELPPRSWLILSDKDLERLGGRRASGLSDRGIAYSGPLYPLSSAGGYFTVFGPAAAGLSSE